MIVPAGTVSPIWVVSITIPFSKLGITFSLTTPTIRPFEINSLVASSYVNPIVSGTSTEATELELLNKRDTPLFFWVFWPKDGVVAKTVLYVWRCIRNFFYFNSFFLEFSWNFDKVFICKIRHSIVIFTFA